MDGQILTHSRRKNVSIFLPPYPVLYPSFACLSPPDLGRSTVSPIHHSMDISTRQLQVADLARRDMRATRKFDLLRIGARTRHTRGRSFQRFLFAARRLRLFSSEPIHNK